MRLRKTSVFTGKESEMEIPCSEADIVRWKNSGRPIQDMLPQLNQDQREFLMSGSTPAEWDELFKEKDE